MNRPRQFGPSRRMPAALAMAIMRACSTAPAWSTSAKPAVSTMAFFTPNAARSATACTAIRAATATTATSGTVGSSDTAS